ncbi:hypothetical protein B9T33_05900 [Acinetobacter sp. ANC 5054]|uniref:hypothetical protein n=1 Tax=Acinetobacter sp. ANC 5054 TaxID=1977877 RepID=UPI000A34BED9|nr:hypothetical protein [Acinetobacter sp. ANC 5054]OTG82050.1 hypothetical protein B9T33_05900 [Acinetobacter sp. ANC 5054]
MTTYRFVQGKIFIHSRRPSTLSWGLHKPVDSIYFEYIIQNQLFHGNFCGLHCQPADQIHAIYSEDNQKKTILGLYNATQQILHLHPKQQLYPQISWSKLWKNCIQLISFLLIFLFVVFSFSAWQSASFQVLNVLTDTLYFTAILAGIILMLSLSAAPVIWLLYWPNFRQTATQLKLLQCSNLDIQALPASVQTAAFLKLT